jgi:hypothetical protein
MCVDQLDRDPGISERSLAGQHFRSVLGEGVGVGAGDDVNIPTVANGVKPGLH